MKNQLYPDDFPDELKADAFSMGAEASWPTGSATKVIDWLRQNGFAVLGTELWIVREDGIQPGIFADGKREIHGNEVSRLQNEPWDNYVNRSGLETLRYLGAFEVPPEARKQGKVFFNIVWANESQFLNLRAK
jgi:hypothetical protein